MMKRAVRLLSTAAETSRPAAAFFKCLPDASKEVYKESLDLFLKSRSLFDKSNYLEAKNFIDLAIKKADLLEGPGALIMGYKLSLDEFKDEVESIVATGSHACSSTV